VVTPRQWPLLCLKWESFYYFYVRLSVGCRSSPKIFDSFSKAVCFIAEHNYNVKRILHLLDDFLTIEPPVLTQSELWRNNSLFVQDDCCKTLLMKLQIISTFSWGSLASSLSVSKIIIRYSMQVNGPIVLCAAMGTFENHHHQGH
jgi:hypothetical protein